MARYVDGYVVPVEYKAHLVFRFDADSTEAQMQGDVSTSHE